MSMAALALPPADPTASDAARYFIGLRPAAAVSERLHRLALALAAARGARAMDAERMHLTLAFLGQVPRSLEPTLCGLLRTLPAPGVIELDELGSFSPALLWVGCSVAPAWLTELSLQLRAGLDRLGVDFDRRPLKPHVTLVRAPRGRPSGAPSRAAGAAGHDLPPLPIDFGIGRLLLVESLPAQGRYRWIEA